MCLDFYTTSIEIEKIRFKLVGESENHQYVY